ncbi:peptidylprolyl isomerase [Candidatus Woesearchaeota archaeon]|nr:peptidylprolyl isomerase [Candidatus Woesearchaeota archaeon]
MTKKVKVKKSHDQTQNEGKTEDHSKEHSHQHKKEHNHEDKAVTEDNNSHKSHKKVKKEESSSLFLIVSAALVLAIVGVAFFISQQTPDTPDTPVPDQPTPGKEGIAASVNGVDITVAELNKQYATIPEQYKTVITKEAMLEKIINEQLLLGEAASSGITVSDEDATAEFERLIAQAGMTTEEFEQSLALEGTDYEDVYATFRNNMIIDKYINVSLKMEVTEQEITDYFAENKDQYIQANASHILLNTSEDALEVIALLDQGEPFYDLAVEYSTGPSSVRGGALGVFGKGVMVKEFEDAVFSQEVGLYSKTPVKTDFGYHIILVHEIKDDIEDFRDVIVNTIRAKKYQTEFEQMLIQFRDNADIQIYLQTDPSDLSAVKSCVADFGLTGEEMIFLHSTTCPHCVKMQPIVDTLVGEGRNIKKVEASSEDAQMVPTCLSTIVTSGAVPQFICLKDGKVLVGERRETELRNFCI